MAAESSTTHAGRRRALALALTLPFGITAAWPMPAEARPGWASGTFIYADLCVEPGSGEPMGRRVTLRRSPNGDGLTYEGAPSPAPVRAESVTLDDTAKTIAFLISTHGHEVAFHGTMAADALIGTVEDEAGAHSVRLPRVLRSHAGQPCHNDVIAGR